MLEILDSSLNLLNPFFGRFAMPTIILQNLLRIMLGDDGPFSINLPKILKQVG